MEIKMKFFDRMSPQVLPKSLWYLVLCVGTTLGFAHASTYPNKSRPSRVLVPFGAASSTDILACALTRGISEVSGMNVIVDNKSGAGGQIGVSAGKSAQPDGYMLVMTTSSTQVLNPHMIPNLPNDPMANFVSVAGVTKFALVLEAGPSLPHNDLRKFLKAARANSDKYSFGSGTAT